MELIFKVSLLLLIFLIICTVSPLTFQIVRIKITIFELLLPWIFLIWLSKNIKNKFEGLSSLPVIIIISVALFFIISVYLYYRNKFYPIHHEELLLNILAFAFLLVIFDEKPDSEQIHRLIIFSSLFVFVYGLFQIFGLDFFRYSREFIDKKRIFSTFANPNDLALFCNLVFFLGLYYLFEEKKGFLIPILILAIINLVFTKSGSGILGFIFGFLVLLLLCKKGVKILLFCSFFIILLTASLFITYLKPESYLYRKSILASTLKIIKQRPIFGWGLRSFQHIYPEFRDPRVYLLLEDHQIEFLHPENYYLDLLVEGGFLYLFLFLFMNSCLFYKLIKVTRKKVRFYYLTIISVFLFQNLFSENFYSFTPFFLYFLIFGLAVREIKKGSRGKIPSLNFKFYKFISVLFLFSALYISYFSLRIFLADFYLRKAIYNSQVKKFSLAETYYLKSIECNYFNPLSHYLLANLYMEKGEENVLYQALTFYNNVEQLAGNYLQVYFFKGLAYYKLGDKKWADYYFQKLLRYDPYLYHQFKFYLENLG